MLHLQLCSMDSLLRKQRGKFHHPAGCCTVFRVLCWLVGHLGCLDLARKYCSGFFALHRPPFSNEYSKFHFYQLILSNFFRTPGVLFHIKTSWCAFKCLLSVFDSEIPSEHRASVSWRNIGRPESAWFFFKSIARIMTVAAVKKL